MKLSHIVAGLVGLGAIAAGLAASGYMPWPAKLSPSATSAKASADASTKPQLAPPLAVTVATAQLDDFVDRVLVTGSLVAREEILVGPEVEGLRVVEVLADEGDRVTKGQVLARLVSDTLEAQLAQNTAAIAKADAAIAQARSAITAAEARQEEANNAYDRAKPLAKSGYLSESGMDQREATRRTTEASLISARDGLRVSEAEKAQVEAQRREIAWRRTRTEIRAPADGLVSRRVARIGGYATGAADSMFRIIAQGLIELDAEVPETRLASIKEGQTAVVDAAGLGPVSGTVRLVSPEVDRATRLGRVRILLGDKPGLRVGAFARGSIETAQSRGLSIPASAVLYGANGAVVQVVIDGRVRTRAVKLGLTQGGNVEIRDGLAAGENVIARSGTFLRDGDAVRAMPATTARANEAG